MRVMHENGVMAGKDAISCTLMYSYRILKKYYIYMCLKCRVLKYEFTVMGVHTDHQMTTEGLNRYPVSDYQAQTTSKE